MTDGVRFEQVRRAILEAAADLYAQRDDISMAEIAEAASVGRATLYRHYDGRDALMEDLADMAFADAHQALRDARIDTVEAAEAIRRTFRALVGVGARFAVVLREQQVSPERAADMPLARQIGSLVRRARDEGVLRDDVPEEWLVSALKALLHGAVHLAETVGIENAAAFGAEQFLSGARSVGDTRGSQRPGTWA